jgi:hypothetical protein
LFEKVSGRAAKSHARKVFATGNKVNFEIEQDARLALTSVCGTDMRVLAEIGRKEKMN